MKKKRIRFEFFFPTKRIAIIAKREKKKTTKTKSDRNNYQHSVLLIVVVRIEPSKRTKNFSSEKQQNNIDSSITNAIEAKTSMLFPPPYPPLSNACSLQSQHLI